MYVVSVCFFFFFQAKEGIRDYKVTGVQTCALPIWEISVSGIVLLQPADARLEELGINRIMGHKIHLLVFLGRRKNDSSTAAICSSIESMTDASTSVVRPTRSQVGVDNGGTNRSPEFPICMAC